MAKSKLSASSIIVPSVFVIHLANYAQFSKATCAAGEATTVISTITKM